MAFALALLLSTQDLAGLIERLDADDVEQRAEAASQLRVLGAAAIPALERALDHPSPEVRGRAGDVLQSLPELRLKFLLLRPDFPSLARLWNGVIDAAVSKRPISSSLASEFDLEGDDLQADDRSGASEQNEGYSAERVVAALHEDGRQAMRCLRRRVGLEDVAIERAEHLEALRRFARPRILPRLFALDLDPAGLEEIVATILILERQDGGAVLWTLSDPEWTAVLEFMALLRRRPGERRADAPRNLAEALDFAARGPWILGLADALGRSFAHQARGGALDMILREKELRAEEEERPLEEIYEVLASLDEQFGHRHFRPSLLAKAAPALPPAVDSGGIPDQVAVDRILSLGDLGDAGPAVAAALVACLEIDPEEDDIRSRLLWEVAVRIVNAAVPR